RMTMSVRNTLETLQTAMRDRATALWTVKTRDPRTGLFVPAMARRNKFTDVGLTNLAKCWGGAGVPPRYLIIDKFKGQLQNNPLAAGALSLIVDVPVHQTGDTQLVLDVGAVGQETVTFTSATGAGPTTYTLSTPTVNSHAKNAWVMRPAKQ